MFVIQDTSFKDYFAGFTIAPKFSIDESKAYTYNTKKAAMNDLTYYGLGEDCVVVPCCVSEHGTCERT
jgi:hypothetical protein